jgi:hypothetical protein
MILRLNKQAFIDRLMGHSHGAIPGMLGAQPSGDLLRRPLIRQLPGDQSAQRRIGCQQARLGTAGSIQCLFVGTGSAIGPAPAIARNFAADRGHRPAEMSPELPVGMTFNKAS